MAEALDATGAEWGDEPLSPELEEQIDAALEAARNSPPAPSVRFVEYLPKTRLLLLHLKSGQRVGLPVEDVEELAQANDEQLAHFQIEGGGFLIHFPDFDGNLDVPYLVAGSRGSRRWMQQLEAKYGTVAALEAA